MKKWRLVSIFIGLIFGLCACVSRQNATVPMPELGNSKNVGIMSVGGMCEVDSGFFREMGDGNTFQICYFDYETQLLFPFCTRVDCDHTRDEDGNTNCTACLLADASASHMCVYDGKIWYLDGSHEGTMTLGQADLTGENARILFELDTDFSAGKVVLYDGYLYMRMERANVTPLGIWDGDIESFVRVNLETGEHEWIEEKSLSYSMSYRVIGFSGTKVFYQYYASEKYPNGAVVFYDCATGEAGALEAKTGELLMAEMNDTYLIYMARNVQEEYLSIIDLNTGEEIDSFPMKMQPVLIVGQEEFVIEDYGQGYYYYNFNDKELKYWDNPELAKEISILHVYKDGYLCEVLDHKTGTMQELATISKDALEKGGTPSLLTKDKLPI